MRLRKPCEHDRYETHALSTAQWGKALSDYEWCSGGEFLAADTLVVEKVADNARLYAIQILRDRAREFDEYNQTETAGMLRSVADALAQASQVGESE